MDFGLTEEQQMMQDMAKNFAVNEIVPTLEDDEKNHRFRPEIAAKMGALSFFGCALPEDYRGNGLRLLSSEERPAGKESKEEKNRSFALRMARKREAFEPSWSLAWISADRTWRVRASIRQFDTEIPKNWHAMSSRPWASSKIITSGVGMSAGSRGCVWGGVWAEVGGEGGGGGRGGGGGGGGGGAGGGGGGGVGAGR